MFKISDQSYSHSSDMDAFKNYATLEEINLCENNLMQRGNQKTESLPVGMFLQQDSMVNYFVCIQFKKKLKCFFSF